MNSTRDGLITLILVLVLVFGGLWLYGQTKGDTVTLNHEQPGNITINVPTPTPTACIVISGKQVCGPVSK